MDISDEHVLVIEHGRAERHYWRDLWRYRELFQVLAWRDVAVRYKQTVIGVAWALIRPFLTMVVFTVIFGKLAGLPSDGGAPYALMVFAGMLPWGFFSTALADASNSLIGNANLISKVYFPRLIVPIAAVMIAFVDFVIGFVILLALMAWYQFTPGWQILAVARVHRGRDHRQRRGRRVDHRAQRQVSRLSIRHPLYRATGPVRVAGRIQLCDRAGEVAPALFAEPDGRGDRRLPLVPTRRRKPALLAGLLPQPRRRRSFSCGSASVNSARWNEASPI